MLPLLHAMFSFGFGALNNAIRSMGSVSVLQGKAFFVMQIQRPIVMNKICIFFRQYLWQSRNHVSCETGLKGVRFCANAPLKVQCVM